MSRSSGMSENTRESSASRKPGMSKNARESKRQMESMCVALGAGFVSATLSNIFDVDQLFSCGEALLIYGAWLKWRYGAITTANRHLNAGRNDKALEIAQAAIKRRPNDLETYITASAACIKLRQPELAIEYASYVLARDPHHELALNNRAGAYLQVHHLEQALTDANKSIELDPRLFNPYLMRALTYSTLHRYDESLADSETCLQLKPGWMYPHVVKALAYLGMREYDKALQSCELLIDEVASTANPAELALALFIRAAVHAHNLQFEKAVYESTQAFEVYSELDAALLLRAYAHCYLRQFENAEADLQTIEVRKCTELERAILLSTRARVQLELGEVESALQNVLQADHLCPDRPEVMTVFGYALMHAERQDEARKMLERVISIDSYSSEAHWLLAQLLKVSDPDKAQRHAARAEALNYKPHLNVEFNRSLVK